MAAITRYWGMGFTNNGDGTTVSDAAGTGAYNSLQNAMSDINGGSYTSDDVTLYCTGVTALQEEQPTANYSIDPASLLITPHTGYEVDSATGPVLSILGNTGANAKTLDIDDDGKLTWDGINILNSRGHFAADCIAGPSSDGGTFRNCIIKKTGNAGSLVEANGRVFENCLLWISNSSNDSTALKFEGGGSFGHVLKNCVVIHESSSQVEFFGSSNSSNTYDAENCAFYAATASSTLMDTGDSAVLTHSGCARNSNLSIGLGTGTYVSTTLSITDGVDFEEPSTDDYRAASGGDLDGGGVGAAGTAADWVGTTRDVTNPDIGYFELASAVGANPRGPLGHPLHGPFAGPIG